MTINQLHKVFVAGSLTWVMIGCTSENAAQLPAIDVESFPVAVQPLVSDTYKRLLAEPNNAVVNGTMGMASHAHGKPALAQDFYQRAESIDPTEFAWIYLGAIVLSDQGKQTQALHGFRRALEVNDSYPPALLRLAELLHSQGETEESHLVFESLVIRQPDYAPALFGYGQLLRDTGESSKAIELFKKAIELVPHYGAAHYALAQSYEAQGDSEQAEVYRKLFQKYTKFGPILKDPVMARVEDLRGFDTTSHHKGRSLERRGQTSGSSKHFSRHSGTRPTKPSCPH